MKTVGPIKIDIGSYKYTKRVVKQCSQHIYIWYIKTMD